MVDGERCKINKTFLWLGKKVPLPFACLLVYYSLNKLLKMFVTYAVQAFTISDCLKMCAPLNFGANFVVSNGFVIAYHHYLFDWFKRIKL